MRRGLIMALFFQVACLVTADNTKPQKSPSLSADLQQDSNFRDGLAAEARFDSAAALDYFLKANTAHPENAFILQKISRQYSDLAVDAKEVSEKRQRCVQALEYGKRAAELQPNDAGIILSLGICYGKLGLYSDTRTRVEYSRLVRQYAERALALNPDYDYAHHVLGRWHYEVATLGAGTSLIVRLIYGGFPSATTAEAVKHLRRAVELAPDRPSHRIELGLALLADGKRDEAKTTLEQALSMPMREKYDNEERARAREALKKL